ncbi:MAG: sugar phosphate isomerase/epimerase [Lachnospiraceae bacterium]|nr:sugar phosphate isomerase/epimerase [Lachnospiraceae bacterium]
MLGSKCSNYEGALSVLREIGDAGYDGIELNDFMIKPAVPIVRIMTRLAGMPVGKGGKLDWHALLEESGRKVVSLHSNLNRLEENPAEVAEEALSFGTDTVVITGMYRFDYGNGEEVQNLALRLEQVGKDLSKYGVKLLYHNHNVELQKVNEAKTAYDVLLEYTDPNYVNFELDTYWMADGGADVMGLMDKLGSRLAMWHINDRGYRKKGPFMTPILKEDAVEPGTGNMPLEAMLERAKRYGVKAIVLETHKNWIDNDPVKSLKVSAAWFQRNGLF